MKKMFLGMLLRFVSMMLSVIFKLEGKEMPDNTKVYVPKPKKLMSESNEEVLEILKYALPSGGIKRKDLLVYLNVDDRTLRKIINVGRKRGVPILTSANGYYISENVEEINKFILSELDSRIDDLLETKTALMFTVANGGKYER